MRSNNEKRVCLQQLPVMITWYLKKSFQRKSNNLLKARNLDLALNNRPILWPWLSPYEFNKNIFWIHHYVLGSVRKHKHMWSFPSSRRMLPSGWNCKDVIWKVAEMKPEGNTWNQDYEIALGIGCTDWFSNDSLVVYIPFWRNLSKTNTR